MAKTMNWFYTNQTSKCIKGWFRDRERAFGLSTIGISTVENKNVEEEKEHEWLYKSNVPLELLSINMNKETNIFFVIHFVVCLNRSIVYAYDGFIYRSIC
jgi:hypothetical protein